MAPRFDIVRLSLIAAALAASPASAAERTDPEVAAWLAENTDLSAARIALVTADHVYSLEPFGPRSATDEVVALARTEAFDGDWGASHGVQSWEAHLLFDCKGKRVRVIRSADYPQRNRKGKPVATSEQGDWLTPSADQPAAKLLSAACDPAFVWPLRAQVQAAAPPPAPRPEAAPPKPPPAPATPPPVIERAGAPSAPTPPPPPPAATPDPAPAGFTIQIGRGPSKEGAQAALKAARKVLGPTAAGLAASTEFSHDRGRPRYTATFDGFPTEAAADAACDKLHAADQHCFVRAGGRDAGTAEAAPPAEPAPAVASAPAQPSPPSAPLQGFVVQLTYGPSEEGAGRAIDRARKALGADGAKLTAATDKTEVAGRTRYTALLGGFESAGAARRACEALQKAQQTCFARSAQAGPTD